MVHKAIEDRREYHRAWRERRRRSEGIKPRGPSRAEKRRIVDELKNNPCMDCGGRFPVVCMDFDHRDPTQKVREISYMVKGCRIEDILAEIEKCDLVCANCHRIRTHGIGAVAHTVAVV